MQLLLQNKPTRLEPGDRVVAKRNGPRLSEITVMRGDENLHPPPSAEIFWAHISHPNTVEATLKLWAGKARLKLVQMLGCKTHREWRFIIPS